MKVAMVTSFPPDRCGISDYSKNLTGAMKNVDLLLISREGPGRGASRIIAKKKVSRSASQFFEEFRGLGRARRDARACVDAIKKFGADVVHVQYEPGLYNLFFAPILFSMLRGEGIKTVLTVHSIDYFPLNIFHRVVLYDKPDRIIVHTNTHKKKLESATKRRVVMIPMGLRPMVSRAERDYFLFFGFLNPHKGIEDLLRAYASSRVRDRFLLTGSINPAFKPDVAYKNRIEILIKELGLEERVKFIYEFIPEKRLRDYIRLSKFVVFPYRSSYSGAQSQAIMDVIALGKPAIVTEPARGNLVHLKNAIVTKPDNVEQLREALRYMSTDSALRRRIARNNASLARKLDWKNIAAMATRLYAKLL